MSVVWSLVVKHWGLIAAIAFCALFARAVHERDSANVAKGKALVQDSIRGVQLKAAQAERDSILGDLIEAREHIAREGAQIVKYVRRIDTLQVPQWFRDTVYMPGDPTPRLAIPVGAVANADSALHLCPDYVAANNVLADAASKGFALDTRTIKDLSKPVPGAHGRRWWGIDITTGIGATRGVAVPKGESPWRAGPTVAAGIGIRF